MEALRLLLAEDTEPMLVVVGAGDRVVGVATKTNILQALKLRRESSTVLADQPLASTEGASA